ncbi:MAG TPA: MFS transporter [Casimicrobiaceae bacterium]|nr:MFS transporter [Casimicrobiaceae bacterium]
MSASTVPALLCARGLRAFADGLISLVLPLYLIGLGLTPFQVGVIATGTLLGSGALTLLVGVYGQRYRHRSALLAAAVLMVLTGIAFATFDGFGPLLLIAVIGTLNPSSGDVSVFLPLEQAVLAQSVSDRKRTSIFARYSLVGALLGALGALAAGLPALIAQRWQLDLQSTYRAMFLVYALLGLAAGAIYRSLPKERSVPTEKVAAPLHRSRRIVYTLAALFSLDAFAGGFLVQSLLALWLFQRFDLSIAVAGSIFFWTGVLSALSYIVASRIAERIGLVNTMVFTHLPSSILLILTPFAPTLAWVIVLLLARSALSQMDVPTRNSYVMAIVDDDERVAAASITSVPRSLASALSPLCAGWLLGLSSFGWPLIVAGVLKILYDLVLLAMFRTVRPPEEMAVRPRSS